MIHENFGKFAKDSKADFFLLKKPFKICHLSLTVNIMSHRNRKKIFYTIYVIVNEISTTFSCFWVFCGV